MKPWIKRTLYGLLGATIVLGGVTACGPRHDGHGMHMSGADHAKYRDKMIEKVTDKLDLNAEQKARAGALVDKIHAQRLALIGKTTDPRAEIQTLVAGDKFNKVRAQALITEKTAALNVAAPEVIAAMADFYDSLNPEQQVKVREFMAGRHSWWRRG